MWLATVNTSQVRISSMMQSAPACRVITSEGTGDTSETRLSTICTENLILEWPYMTLRNYSGYHWH